MFQQDMKLPDLDKPEDNAVKTQTKTDESPIHVGSATSTKEMVIALGCVLVAAIVFFIVKNFVSKVLVSSQKKTPRTADLAGWSLFCVLLLGTITAVLAILDSDKFLTFPYLIPISLAMLVSLIMFFVPLFSKR